MKGFAKRFNSLRLEGETQKEFADRLGLTQASISRYLSGHSPDRESLRRIAVKTGVSVDWMLTGNEVTEIEIPAKGKKAIAKSANPVSDKELLQTGLSYLDRVKLLAPAERQALKLMVQDLFENKEHLQSVMEHWNELRLTNKTPRGRRKSIK